MAPEYAMHGYLTEKVDVYSFGVVALEIVSGKHNTMNRPRDECFSLVDWVTYTSITSYLPSNLSLHHNVLKFVFHLYQVHFLKEEGNIMDLVDERLDEDFKKEEAMIMINVALLCTRVSPMHRPTMSSVVSMLEGQSAVEEVIQDTSQDFEGNKLEIIQQYHQQLEIIQQYCEQSEKVYTTETQEESILTNATSEFMSDTDMHSISMDSPYRSFNTL